MRRRYQMAARLGALIIMVLGCVLVFSSVILMNKHTRPAKKEIVRSVPMMNAEQKKKPPKRKRDETPQRKPKASDAPRAPLPDLASSLSGADLGMPAFDIGQVMGLAQNAVGASSARNLVMTEESVDVAPKPVRRVSPAYPARARSKNIEGHVTLRVLIGTAGKVEKVKVEDSNPAGVFDEAASQAVRDWQFEPALYRGEKVRVWAKQTVRFNLG